MCDAIMSGIQWSQEQTMLFLETLQAETIIWDPSEKGHKDKKKVNDAWVRIRDILEIPVEELKKKKDSLFATYRGYYRKIEASLKSGAGADDVYRPVWFAFEFMNSFLGSVYKCKQTITTDHGTDLIQEEPTNASEDVPIASPTPKEPEPPKNSHTIRRRDNPPELQVASRQMTEAFNNLNKIINNPSKDSSAVEDECDVLGKLIAKKLKRLPEHERDDIMFDIHALFRKSRYERSPSVESFRTSTPRCTPYYIPSTTSISSRKRPLSANNAVHYIATALSPRPHSSFSEPPDTYITLPNQSSECQPTYIQQPNEITAHQRSSNIRVISDEIIAPDTQSQSVYQRYKRPQSDQSDDVRYILDISETQTQSVCPEDNTHKSDLIYQAYNDS